MKKLSLPLIIIYTILFLGTIAILWPLLNIVALSFADPAYASQMSGLDIIPRGFSLINYQVLLSNPLIVRSLFNSIFITVVGTIINLLLTAMAAYVLTRPKFVGKGLFMTLLIIMMVFEPGLIQEFLVVQQLGLLNTYWSVLLHRAVDVYYLIILMRFFEEIPESLIESAKIEGAGHIKIFTKVMIPLAAPALATIGFFYGVLRWNEFFRASIYLTDQNLWPLQLVMRQFVVLNDTTAMVGGGMLDFELATQLNHSSLQAGTIVLAVVPLLIIYPFILKFYTKGAFDGGVKE